MALTEYTAATNIIGSLGTDPEDRPTLDDQGLKDKFDENAVNIVTYLNDTHLPEVQAELDLKPSQAALDLKAPLASPTFTGTVTAPTNTDYGTRQVRNVVLSTSDPSGGSNGDIWFKYTP